MSLRSNLGLVLSRVYRLATLSFILLPFSWKLLPGIVLTLSLNSPLQVFSYTLAFHPRCSGSSTLESPSVFSSPAARTTPQHQVFVFYSDGLFCRHCIVNKWRYLVLVTSPFFSISCCFLLRKNHRTSLLLELLSTLKHYLRIFWMIEIGPSLINTSLWSGSDKIAAVHIMSFANHLVRGRTRSSVERCVCAPVAPWISRPFYVSLGFDWKYSFRLADSWKKNSLISLILVFNCKHFNHLFVFRVSRRWPLRSHLRKTFPVWHGIIRVVEVFT